MMQNNVDITNYDALNFDGLERKANYRVIAFREDVLVAFERKDAAAILYNIISRWLDNKRDEIIKENEQRRKQGLSLLSPQEVEERMWVYMSYNDFARECGGAVSYNTVIAMLDYLVNVKQVFERRENHDPRFADYEYRINRKVMVELLKALPVHPPTYTKVGIGKKKAKTYTNSGTPTTKVGIDDTNSGIGVYQSWGTSQNHTDYTQESTQNTHRVAVANADAHATSFSDETQTTDQQSHPEREQLPITDTSEALNASQPPETLPQQKEAAKIASESDKGTTTSANENPSIQDETDIHIAQKAQEKEKQVKSKGRQPGKPKAPEDPAIAERVKRVYTFFDKLAQEIGGVKDFHYQPTSTTDKAIKNWLKGNPTEPLLREVFLELWNSPADPRTGFYWQDHMKIPLILKEYDSRVLAIKARHNKKQQQAKGIVSTATQIAGYTRQFDTDDEDIVYQSKAERTQRKRA